MKKLILIAGLMLSACTSQLESVLDPASAPAPLAKTTIDDRALQAAWKSFDVSLDAINLAMDLKPSLIGTPGAKRLANAIDAVSAALTAAEHAVAAGSTTNYITAMANVRNALTEMRLALTAMKGQ